MDAAPGDLGRREMLAEIRKLCAPDNRTNWFVLGREYAFLALVVAGCLGSYRWIVQQGWSLWWMLPIYTLSVLAIGLWTQNRLAVLIHESSHFLLFRSRMLNELAANLFVAFPLFAGIGNYRAVHWTHHRHVNDPEQDPDLKRLRSQHPRNFPVGRWRFLWEYVVLQVLPHNAFHYLRERARYAAAPATSRLAAFGEEVLSRRAFRALRIGHFVVLATVLTWFGWWPEFVLLWIVPMVTVYPAVLFLREIAHHGNYPDNGDFTNSRVYEGKWLEREIFFPFSEQNHVLHHMFPAIPWHKMRSAHEVMMRYPPYRENVLICDGFFFKGSRTSDHPTVLEVLAAPSQTYLHGRAGAVPNGIRRTTAQEVGSTGVCSEAWSCGES
jgi:fatty acid desaturase